ncbi:hypothetical protein B484DRAFT_424947 [Ochromonadaceae sp. CCMP2298]|nr:hypothetical protein B484DRAFT_424947 [Ochromonadaceae sp. CCMP2298]
MNASHRTLFVAGLTLGSVTLLYFTRRWWLHEAAEKKKREEGVRRREARERFLLDCEKDCKQGSGGDKPEEVARRKEVQEKVLLDRQKDSKLKAKVKALEVAEKKNRGTGGPNINARFYD